MELIDSRLTTVRSDRLDNPALIGPDLRGDSLSPGGFYTPALTFDPGLVQINTIKHCWNKSVNAMDEKDRPHYCLVLKQRLWWCRWFLVLNLISSFLSTWTSDWLTTAPITSAQTDHKGQQWTSGSCVLVAALWECCLRWSDPSVDPKGRWPLL